MRTLVERALLGASALVAGLPAVTAYGQEFARRPVELDGTDVTHISVTAGAQGTVAQDNPWVEALLYDAEATGYMFGCFGHGGGIGWADELRPGHMVSYLWGGRVNWYQFSYAAGYGFLGGSCTPGDPGGGDCDCYCPSGGLCDEGDPPYTVDAALYDGPPGACGGGLPIPGTEALFETNASRPLGDEIITATVHVDPNALVPGDVFWGVISFDIEDAWLVIGQEPYIGSSTMDGAFWVDADSDGTWDTWECWPDPYPWDCPDCTGWMAWSVAAKAQIVFSLVPVMPPVGSEHPGAYTIEKNAVTMDEGDQVVFFELHVSDFDPWRHGMLLNRWQARIDAAAGYASGLQGTLAPHYVDCTADPSVCETQMGPGSECPSPATNCPAGFIDKGREDYIFYSDMQLNGVDVSTQDYWYWAMLLGLRASSLPDYYLGTLVLYVPPDAKGTFTIPFVRRDTELTDSNSQPFPLVGMQPGVLTVTVGRCCFGVGEDDEKAGCIEDVTANQCVNAGLCKGFCDLNPGILCLSDFDCQQQGAPGSICVAGATLGQNCFTVPEKPDGKPLGCEGPDICVVQGKSFLLTDGLTCDDPCCECNTDADCDDGVACTNDSCGADCLCIHMPDGANCDDANPCTDDWCDPAADCQFVNDDTNDCDDGAYCNGAEYCSAGQCVAPGDPCGDGLACTTDTCYESTDSCTNEKIDCTDANPCTIDTCVEPSGTCSNIQLDTAPPSDPALCVFPCETFDDCPIDQYTGMPVATECKAGCCGCYEAGACCLNGGTSCTTVGLEEKCTEIGGTFLGFFTACEGDAEGDGFDDACPQCGDTTCDPGEDQCNCGQDCGAHPLYETACNDGADNDCDGLTDSDDPDCARIPTVSGWGVIVLAFLLLVGAKVYFGCRRAVPN